MTSSTTGSPSAITWLYVLADVATKVFAVIAVHCSLIPILTSIQFDNVTDDLRINRSFFMVTALGVGFIPRPWGATCSSFPD